MTGPNCYLLPHLVPMKMKPLLSNSIGRKRRGLGSAVKFAMKFPACLSISLLLLSIPLGRAAESEPVIAGIGQPLAANASRLVEALDLMGAPLSAALKKRLTEA